MQGKVFPHGGALKVAFAISEEAELKFIKENIGSMPTAITYVHSDTLTVAISGVIYVQAPGQVIISGTISDEAGYHALKEEGPILDISKRGNTMVVKSAYEVEQAGELRGQWLSLNAHL